MEVKLPSKRTIAELMLAAILLFSISTGKANADPPSAATSLLRAIELIDSVDDRERHASEQSLRNACQSDDRNPLAVCGLCFACFRAGDAAETLQWIAAIPKPEPLPKELRVAIAKLELCSAVAAPDPNLAEIRFKGIVKAALNAKTEMRQRQVYVELAAEVISLLGVLGDSLPIKPETLDRANEVLTVIPDASLALSYKAAIGDGRKRASKVQEWVQKLESLPVERRAQLLEELKLENEKLRGMVEDESRTASQATANQKDLHRIQVVGSRKLNQEYRLASMEPIATGHPGPPHTPPVLPVKSRIRVRETERERTKDGKWETVRRPQHEIDLERESKFQDLMRDYNISRSVYERNVVVHAQSLQDWQQREQLRKEELNKRLNAIKESEKRLADEEKEAEEVRKAGAEKLRSTRERHERLQEDFRFASLVDRCMRSEKPMSPYGAACMLAVSVANEKTVLLRAFRQIDK